MSHASRSAQFQVEHNQESSRRQYALGDKARHLGWREVETIDEDMGCSGSGSEKRSGFERMVAAVGMGQVGAVFSIEASRLARNNRDWHQLVDICGMVGTLIIDEDGIYDATILNDRLLLGLKGTMSEFELAMIRQRMHAGLLQKARRGELLLKMAIGYMSTKDERCEKDPDERVRAAIELVFNKFEQTGSARQTLLWFRQEGVELPSTVYGAQGRAVEWRTPVYTTILNIITNPTYAGAYAFGRAVTETCVENGHIRKKQKKLNAARAREQWLVLIKDHHEGYITWQEYEDNQFRESAPEKSNSLSAESTTPHATRCWRRNERLCEGGQGIIVFDTVTGSETVKDDGYMVSRVDRVSEEPGGH